MLAQWIVIQENNYVSKTIKIMQLSFLIDTLMDWAAFVWLDW